METNKPLCLSLWVLDEFQTMDFSVIVLTEKVIGINSVRISMKLDQRITE